MKETRSPVVSSRYSMGFLVLIAVAWFLWAVLRGDSTSSVSSSRDATPSDFRAPKRAGQAKSAALDSRTSTITGSKSRATGFELWTALYHMTHETNLESILELGIMSRNRAKFDQLVLRDISEQSVQARRERTEPIFRRSLHEYAPFYLNPKNPMLYRRLEMQDEIVILKVSRSVLAPDNHLFTDGNAAARSTQFGTNESVARRAAPVLRAQSWNDLPDGKRRRCAEVLVYPEVAPSFIDAVICRSKSLADRIRIYSPVPVVIDPSVFF